MYPVKRYKIENALSGQMCKKEFQTVPKYVKSRFPKEIDSYIIVSPKQDSFSLEWVSQSEYAYFKAMKFSE